MEKNSEEDKDNPTITIIKMLFLAASCDPCSTSLVPKLNTLALCICFYLFLVKSLCVSFAYEVILSFNPLVYFSILYS